MLIEENAEAYYIQRIEDQTYPTGLKPKQVYELGAMDEIDDIMRLVRIAPSVMVGIVGDTPINEMDTDGLEQIIEYNMAVVIVVPDKYKQGTSATNAHQMHRVIKSALRGHLYSHSDSDSITRIVKTMYRGRRIITQESGILIFQQNYVLQVMDT